MYFLPINYVNLFHIFIIAPLLFYIGYNKNNTKPIFFISLSVLSLIIIPLFVPFPDNLTFNYWNIIKVFHWFVLLPLFLYIGYSQKLSDDAHDLIIVSSIFITIYHSYKYYTRSLKI